MKNQEETTDDNSGDDSDEELFYDKEDNGQTEEEEEEDNKEELKPDNVVWGLQDRHWHCGRLCIISDVQSNIQHKFESLSNCFIVYWYGDEMYGLAKMVKKLGETQVDAKHASPSGEIKNCITRYWLI